MPKNKRKRKGGVDNRPISPTRVDQILAADKISSDSSERVRILLSRKIPDRLSAGLQSRLEQIQAADQLVGESPDLEMRVQESLRQDWERGLLKDQDDVAEARRRFVRGETTELLVLRTIQSLIDRGRIEVPKPKVLQAPVGYPVVDFWIRTSNGFKIPLQVKSSRTGEKQHLNKHPSIPCIFTGLKTEGQLEQHIAITTEAAYQTLFETRKEWLLTGKKLRPSIGETHRTIIFEGDTVHTESELVDFHRLLNEVCEQINLGGDLIVKSSAMRVQGTPALKGLSTTAKPEGTQAVLYYQPGGNETRFKYYLGLPPNLTNTVTQLLLGVCGTAYTGKEVKQKVTPEVKKPLTKKLVVSNPTHLPALPKLTEPPEGGYHKNATWLNLVLDHMERVAGSDEMISKQDALDIVDQASHFEKSFAGYGTLFGQLVGRGWLEEVEKGSGMYRIERENPIAARFKGKKPTKVSAAVVTAKPVEQSVQKVKSGYVFKFIHTPEVLNVYLSEVNALEDNPSKKNVLTGLILRMYPDFDQEQANYIVKNLVIEGYFEQVSHGQYGLTQKALYTIPGSGGDSVAAAAPATPSVLPSEYERLQKYVLQLEGELSKERQLIAQLQQTLTAQAETQLSQMANGISRALAHEIDEFLATSRIH